MHTDLISIRTTCRVCGAGGLEPILSLGELHVSDFVKEAAGAHSTFPLDLVLCNEGKGGCGLLQLKHTVSHEAMYRNYWYRSGMNRMMTEELKGIARLAESLAPLAQGDYVMDIGANDGTLLRAYRAHGIVRTGFEPAKNLAKWNSEGTAKIIPDFFSAALWKKGFGKAKAKVITAIAMFYDLEDPNAFVRDVAECLDDDGVCIIQMSYLPLMLSQNAFDNICHEHLEYYSLLSLEHLLRRHRLEVFDVELNAVNGGSFRTYIRHAGKGKRLRPAPGAAARVARLRAEEAALGLHRPHPYREFAGRVEAVKRELVSLIERETARGKTVYVYGASTKGNTTLQYCGLRYPLITAAAERNPDKWGFKTVGTHIPVISEAQARKEKPDYFLVLPWHFMEEFMEREKEFLLAGGKFIVPLPRVEVIGVEASTRARR